MQSYAQPSDSQSLLLNRLLKTLSVFGVIQLGRKADRRARTAEPKFCVWFLWGNGNELRGLRAKFWRGPSYHAKGGLSALLLPFLM